MAGSWWISGSIGMIRLAQENQERRVSYMVVIVGSIFIICGLL